jgi:hypothetical protein
MMPDAVLDQEPPIGGILESNYTIPAISPSKAATESKDEGLKSSSIVMDSINAEAPNIEISQDETDDTELLQQAEDHVASQRYFVAARLLRRVSDTSLLQPKHERVLQMAAEAQEVLDTLLQYPSDDATDATADSADNSSGGGWKKQGERHGHRDTAIHYKLDDHARLTCRIETPIEESLLVPMLSVFNESELYATWMPSWRFPRTEVAESLKLAEYGRGNQVQQLTVKLPLPMWDRQLIQHGFAVDDIDADGAIVVKMQSCPPGPFRYAPAKDDCRDDGKGLKIPEVAFGVIRMDFDGGILIRACPADHPLLLHSAEKKAKKKKTANSATASSYPPGEKLLLLSFTEFVDAHFTYVPTASINFLTRTLIGSFWGALLQVAEDVRDGKRPLHTAAIQAKGELYDWAKDRVEVMFDKIMQEEVEKAKGEAEKDQDLEKVEAAKVEGD